MLDIYAGPAASKRIKEQGFSQDLFTTFLGASGGPKWFVLFGTDKYLFGEFFKGRQQELNLVGSSAGAFRASCFAQNDPVAAISRLAKHYSETVYSKNADASEVTQKARELMDALMGSTGVEEIMTNPVFKAHFVVAKCQGFAASENKALQTLALVKSYLLNRFNRKYLRSQYQRYIFQSQNSNFAFTDPDGFYSKTLPFTPDNVVPSLLASGSIPLVMEGIKDIPDAPKGMYRDGGIIDYHFDMAIDSPGLTLYPHFSSTLRAGWFDKNLSRQVRASHYDNAVVICPSANFVEQLPYQKIPDRKDFTAMEAEQRIQYWRTVMSETERLAEYLANFVDKQQLEIIKPIQPLVA